MQILAVFVNFLEFGVNICKILEIKDTFRILQTFSLPLFIFKKCQQTLNGENLCKILDFSVGFRILHEYSPVSLCARHQLMHALSSLFFVVVYIFVNI